MKPLRYRAEANEDLVEIHLWIARDNPAAAAQTIKRLDAAVQRLTHFPESAPERPEIGHRVRSIGTRGYLILYRVELDHVDILRVVHGSEIWRDCSTSDAAWQGLTPLPLFLYLAHAFPEFATPCRRRQSRRGGRFHASRP